MSPRQKLLFAAYAMGIQVALALPGLYLEFLSSKRALESSALLLYITLIVISGLLYCFGMYGFVLLAKKYRNILLEYSAYSFIGLGLLTIFTSTAVAGMTRSPENIPYMVTSLIMSFLTGVPGIPFAIGLFQLKPKLGGIAEGAGVLSVVISACLLTIIFSIVGLILLLPLTILLIVILLRESKK